MAAGRRVECRADPLFTALRTYNSTADRPIYTRPSASTTHYCLPVASIRRQQQQHIAVVPLWSPSLSRVYRFFAVAIPLFSLVSDTAITLLLYRLLYHCCCFCCVFWYFCVSTPRTRNRKSYGLLLQNNLILTVYNLQNRPGRLDLISESSQWS